MTTLLKKKKERAEMMKKIKSVMLNKVNDK